MMDTVSKLIDLNRIYAQMAEEEHPSPDAADFTRSLWGIHNRLIVTQEVLGFYNSAWNSERISDWAWKDDSLNNEFMDRLLTVTKNLYVDIMSIVENGAKGLWSRHPDPSLMEQAKLGRRFLYLRDIMNVSMQNGLISGAAFREWEDLLNVRNLVVHNNSIADRSYRMTVGDIRISMRPDRMMKGPLKTFVVLSENALTLYYHWAHSLLQFRSPPTFTDLKGA